MKILIGAVVGLVAITGVWFVVHRDASTTTQTVSDAQQNTASWIDVMKSGGDHVCTVSVTKGPSPSQGTVYVSGKDIRGDFESAVGGQTIHASMILTGGFVYNWTDKYPQGVKVPVAPNTDPVTVMTKTQGDMQGVSYDCKGWTRDEAKFALPTSVKFMALPTNPAR